MAPAVHCRAVQAVPVLLRQTAAKAAAPAASAAAAGRLAAMAVAVARRPIHVLARPRQDALCRHGLAGGSSAIPRLSLLARRAYSSSPPPYDHKLWSFEEIKDLVGKTDSPVVIVDVREPAELKDTGRIPGAINIPVTTAPDGFFLPDDEFEDRFGFARPGRDTEVVFYCKAGVRSRAAAGLAKEAGWTKVGEYPGSWLDWAGNGGPIERK